MKNFVYSTYLISVIALFFFFENSFAQHIGQFDDGTGHYSLLKGSPTGGTYILPASGGTLVTTTSPGSIPLGGIIMWSGSIANIPAGWALCDGAVHSGQPTPDLRDKFIVGAGNTYPSGSTGGSTNPVYTASGIITTSSDLTNITIGNGGSLSYTINWSPFISSYTASSSISGALCACTLNFSYTTVSNQAVTQVSIGGYIHSHPVIDPGHNHTFDASGISITTPSNLPPYYALAYIMRVQ